MISTFKILILAAWPDLALLPKWWGKNLAAVDSWRRHFRTLDRRDGVKPDLVKITIPKDLGVYFGPPLAFIQLPNGNFELYYGWSRLFGDLSF